MGWLPKYRKGNILKLDAYPEGFWSDEKCKIKIIKHSFLHRTYTYIYLDSPYFNLDEYKIINWHSLEKLNGTLSLSSTLKNL